MNRISKILISVTVLLQLCWLLPWCYNFLTASNETTPFVMYSSLLNDFVSMTYTEEDGLQRVDTKGNHYTTEQTDSLFPFFYVRQLMADERFPETIKGMKITPHEIQMSNFTFRINAYDLNRNAIPLYPLLESLPKRVDLEMSDDVFRITENGIEFIVMETNEINQEKSEIFTEMLRRKGFEFPARFLNGNPTTQKEYDEGYLILDAEGKLFHMKMVCGCPYVKAIDIPEGVEFEYLYITEFFDHKTLGLLVDNQNRLYVLMAETYEIIKTELPSFNPEKDDCIIIGNMLDWCLCVNDGKMEHNYALDAEDFHLLKTLSYPVPDHSISILKFTSYRDRFVKARFF